MSKLKYLNGVTSCMKCAVLYPIDAKNPLWKKTLYYFWCVYYISSFVITVIQCIMELLIEPFNLTEQSSLIMNLVIFVSLFMNFIVFFYYSENMVALVNNINENFQDKTDNEIEEVGMEYYIKCSDKFARFWTLSLIASASYRSILSLLLSNDRILPIGGWFPYEYTKSPFLEISYFWQVLCQLNVGLIYGCSDMIFPAITIVVGYQFKVLANNFKNSFYYAIWKSGISKKTVTEFKNKLEDEDLAVLYEQYECIYTTINRNEYHQIMINYFKKNIKHYQFLLTCGKDLNQIMELFLMAKVVAAFFNMTLIVFSVITSGDYSQIVALGSYVVFGILEVFLYTYGGQILTENADFLWTLYEVPWYLCDLKFQKMFLFVQMRVGKMIYTKAGNYFPMYAPMFISFMKAIYTYAALLKEFV